MWPFLLVFLLPGKFSSSGNSISQRKGHRAELPVDEGGPSSYIWECKVYPPGNYRLLLFRRFIPRLHGVPDPHSLFATGPWGHPGELRFKGPALREEVAGTLSERFFGDTLRVRDTDGRSVFSMDEAEVPAGGGEEGPLHVFMFPVDSEGNPIPAAGQPPWGVLEQGRALINATGQQPLPPLIRYHQNPREFVLRLFDRWLSEEWGDGKGEEGLSAGDCWFLEAYLQQMLAELNAYRGRIVSRGQEEDEDGNGDKKDGEPPNVVLADLRLFAEMGALVNQAWDSGQLEQRVLATEDVLVQLRLVCCTMADLRQRYRVQWGALHQWDEWCTHADELEQRALQAAMERWLVRGKLQAGDQMALCSMMEKMSRKLEKLVQRERQNGQWLGVRAVQQNRNQMENHVQDMGNNKINAKNCLIKENAKTEQEQNERKGSVHVIQSCQDGHDGQDQGVLNKLREMPMFERVGQMLVETIRTEPKWPERVAEGAGGGMMDSLRMLCWARGWLISGHGHDQQQIRHALDQGWAAFCRQLHVANFRQSLGVLRRWLSPGDESDIARLEQDKQLLNTTLADLVQRVEEEQPEMEEMKCPEEGMREEEMKEGMEPEGMKMEGMEPEGMKMEGMEPEGMKMEGMEPEGMKMEGMEPEGIRPEAMEAARLDGMKLEEHVLLAKLGQWLAYAWKRRRPLLMRRVLNQRGAMEQLTAICARMVVVGMVNDARRGGGGIPDWVRGHWVAGPARFCARLRELRAGAMLGTIERWLRGDDGLSLEETQMLLDMTKHMANMVTSMAELQLDTLQGRVFLGLGAHLGEPELGERVPDPVQHPHSPYTQPLLVVKLEQLRGMQRHIRQLCNSWELYRQQLPVEKRRKVMGWNKVCRTLLAHWEERKGGKGERKKDEDEGDEDEDEGMIMEDEEEEGMMEEEEDEVDEEEKGKRMRGEEEDDKVWRIAKMMTRMGVEEGKRKKRRREDEDDEEEEEDGRMDDEKRMRRE